MQEEQNVVTYAVKWKLCCFGQGGKSFHWPDDAVRAAVSLEKATHDSLSSDFQKYNQKVRSLCYNLSVRI